VWPIRAADILDAGDHSLTILVRVKLPVTDPTVAVIIVEPIDTQLASPVVGPTVATDGVPDIQFARFVTLLLVPSE
jgi:hypothetical protein